MRKLFFLGIDALDSQLLSRFISRGNLPIFEDLCRTGVYGRLSSTIPPVTIPAWPAMLTGLGPGHIGYVSFLRPDRFLRSTPFHSSICQGRYVWDILGKAGKRVGVINVPGTTPPYPVRGYLIPGMFRESDRQYFPEELNMTLNQRSLDEGITARSKVRIALDNFANMCSVLWQLEDRFDTLAVFFVVRVTDEVLHHTVDEQLVENVYMAVDQFLAQLTSLCARHGWNLVIASDHGAAWAEKRFNINTFFAENGWFRFRRTSDGHFLKVADLINRVGLKSLALSAVETIRKATGRRPGIRGKEGLLSYPDWSGTLVFAMALSVSQYMGIWFNDAAVFDQGHRVQDRDALYTQICQRLLDFRDPDTGKEVLTDVWPRDEIYHGARLAELPDLIVRAADGYSIDFRPFPKAVTRSGRYMHALHGVFLACGPDFRSGYQLEGARIVDVAPTLLHLQGIAIPQGLDGRVLTETFSPTSLAAQSDPVYEASEDLPTQSRGYCAEDEARVLERLRSLGYL